MITSHVMGVNKMYMVQDTSAGMFANWLLGYYPGFSMCAFSPQISQAPHDMPPVSNGP